MMFPFPLGSGPGVDKPRDHWRLIRRLGGTGFSQDEGSIRDRENRADGAVTSTGGTSNARAIAQAFPFAASEMLPEWSEAQRLINARAKTQQQQQQQAAGIERLSGGASAANIANAIDAFTGVAVSIVKPTAPNRIGTLMAATGLEHATIYNMAVQMADDAFEDGALVESLTEVLRRVIPARNHGQHTIGELSALLTSDSAPTINSATAKLGRSTINPNLLANDHNVQPHNALVVSYGPNTALRAEDLNRIQDATILRASDPVATAAVNNDASGYRAFLSASQDTGGTKTRIWTIGETDMRYRLVRVRMAQSTTDKIPGGASENSVLNAHTELLWYTGDGTATYDITIGDFTLKASGASGPFTNLLLTTNNAAGTRYWVGLFEMTRKLV